MKTIEDLEIYAKENFIPIARKELVSFLIELVNENNFKKILECGSGIAYTSIQLALINDVRVDTFEYYEPRYIVAKENIKDFGLEDKITLSSENILNATLDNDYDLIFVDGAKKHTIELYKFLKTKIKPNGIIIVDNIDLKVVNQIEIPSKKIKYQKIVEETQAFFKNIKDRDCKYMAIGDGVYIIKNF